MIKQACSLFIVFSNASQIRAESNNTPAATPKIDLLRARGQLHHHINRHVGDVAAVQLDDVRVQTDTGIFLASVLFSVRFHELECSI